MQKYLLFILLFLSISTVTAQVVINEICAANKESLTDQFGDTPDWVELYNAGNQAINIKNYYLSDGESKFLKWQFPNLEMPPQSFLLVLASSRNLLDTSPLHTTFKLSKTGEKLTLSNTDGKIIDQVLTPPLESDITYGRTNDGGEEWGYFSQPTPANSNQNATQTSRATAPIFSIKEQFQSTSFVLNLDCEGNDCEIHFTTDGSTPDEDAPIWEQPMTIDKNTVIRAFTKADNQLNSLIQTRTFFIQANHDLPVIAISTEADNLFDPQTGIFQKGDHADPDYPFYGANFWDDVEIPVAVEYFDINKNRVAEFNVGSKVHGGRGARTRAQKPLRLLAEHQYGNDKLEYKFFPDKGIDSFERIVLRNASGDFNAANFRDGYLARLFNRSEVDLDILAYQPAAWYINGEYFGMISVREKSDEYYVEDNYGIPPERIDMLEEDTLVVVGNFEIFDEHYIFSQENDLSREANFNRAATYFDTKNMADYFILHSAVNSADWLHNNIKYWRERTPTGKWRYLSFDMDIAMWRHGWTAVGIDVFGNKMLRDYEGKNRHVNILTALLTNENYRNYFANRYCDLLNTVLRPEIFAATTRAMKAEIQTEMVQHFNRWKNCYECYDYDYWDTNQTRKAIEFAEQRAPVARQYVQDYFNLESQVLLELNVFPSHAGRIQINTITPEQLPWTGYYFNGIPVTLTAIPNPGFTFENWQSERFIKSPNTENDLIFNFTEDDVVTAYFDGTFSGLNTSVFPNPLIDNELNVNFVLATAEELTFELYAVDGKLVQNFPKQAFKSGAQKIVLPLENLAQGMYFLRITGREIDEVVKLVR